MEHLGAPFLFWTDEQSETSFYALVVNFQC